MYKIQNTWIITFKTDEQISKIFTQNFLLENVCTRYSGSFTGRRPAMRVKNSPVLGRWCDSNQSVFMHGAGDVITPEQHYAPKAQYNFQPALMQ